MLITDLKIIGERLREYRKQSGLTQAELAEAANLSNRSYTDIERGISNTRISTFLKICEVLNITPDLILTTENPEDVNLNSTIERMEKCNQKERITALKIINSYLQSL